MSDFKNLIITVLLSTLILVGWQYFYENPKIEQSVAKAKLHKENSANSKASLDSYASLLDPKTVIKETKRVKIISDKLTGSINLEGMRFDDLSLTNYKNSPTAEDGNVVLLSPSNTKNSYFIETGWVGNNIELPNSHTVWQADKEILKPNDSIDFHWTNSQNLNFKTTVSLDNNYMFSIKQTVKNNSNHPINLAPFGLINKLLTDTHKSYTILHEGPIGVFKGKLVERTYEDLKKKNKENFEINSSGDWLGITDKYWLTALIPSSKINFNTNFTHLVKGNHHLYQTDFLGNMNQVAPGQELEFTHLVFTGAKELKLLDQYEAKYGLKLFDHAVDFGWFYFLTKPMFNALQYFYKVFGNFGIAILILTISIKLIMFPLANRSYKSMSKMKKLQPEFSKLKELYGDDKLRINKEMIELYKKHNVNPLSGCLPLIVQIPVFFSLYKVLFVTIEMRHAPFFGWIKDLSAPDPTSLFNMFGLLPWDPPSFLAIGIWPILMGITMYFQQKMNPEPADPIQAQVMKFLPLIFIFMFSNFPAGLIIYWAWNNLLSIIQQWIINRSLDAQPVKK